MNKKLKQHYISEILIDMYEQDFIIGIIIAGSTFIDLIDYCNASQFVEEHLDG